MACTSLVTTSIFSSISPPPSSTMSGLATDHSGPIQRHVLAYLRKAFLTEEHCDYIIICGDESWSVHKVVISSFSDFFAAAVCTPGFAGGNENSIELTDFAPGLISAMVEFMYTHGYSDSVSSREGTPAMLFNLRMCILAAKYDVFGLQDVAAEKFKTYAEQEWQTATFAVAIGELYACLDAGTRCSMRDIVIEVCKEHAKALLLRPEGASFRQMMSSTPMFSTEVAIALMQARSKSFWYTCADCGKELTTDRDGDDIDQNRCPSCHACGCLNYTEEEED